MTKQKPHLRERRSIDRHFSGRITAAAEVALRNHLGACPDCRDYYDRHAQLAQIDPQSLPVQERLGAALGFAPASPVQAAWRRWALVLAPVAATALVVLAVRWRPAADPASEFTARSARVEPALYAYRVSHGRPAPLAARMAPGDELAFAYENPTRYQRLIVAAVDDQGSVFWYHPDPEVSARAVPIAQAPGRHELPVAIRHDYRGHSLRIFGIFSNQSLSVADVRPLLGPSGCSGLRRQLPAVDIACVEQVVALGQEKQP
jgi:hypothetical protein